MSDDEATVTATVLARGLVDTYERIATDGSAVQQDASLPQSARRALARLSRHCMEASVDDLGSSIHLVMGRASTPMGEWGVPAFADPFRYAGVTLANAELGVPTDDCRELARLGGSELGAAEDLHHDQLRAAVLSFPASRRHETYTAIREFVVRHPAVPLPELHRFIGRHAAAARAIATFYRGIPQSAISGGTARLCGRCGSLLWPERDPSYPLGRCRVRRCAIEGDTVAGAAIEDPSTWRLATAAVLAFWVGPGLDEVRLHDALVERGIESTLYPQSDAADVAIGGLALGIDVKSYASPLLLGSRLSHSIGRLAMFGRRIVALPDYKLLLNARYLHDLRAAYTGEQPLEFATISQVLAEAGA